MRSNVREGVVFASPRTERERVNVAGSCVRNLGIELPAVIDEPDNHVERAYTGWPDRLYVIDRAGKIAHKSNAGPFGFKPAEVEARLRQLL